MYTWTKFFVLSARSLIFIISFIDRMSLTPPSRCYLCSSSYETLIFSLGFFFGLSLYLFSVFFLLLMRFFLPLFLLSLFFLLCCLCWDRMLTLLAEGIFSTGNYFTETILTLQTFQTKGEVLYSAGIVF
jgi:hypothetical protein